MPRLRFKASRPTYRRGGLVLGSTSWVVVEIGLGVTPGQLLALIEDPVVLIETENPAGLWTRLTSVQRENGAAKLRPPAEPQPHNPTEEGRAGNGDMAGGGAEGAALSGEQYQVQTPAPAGGEDIGQADAGLVVDAGGRGDSSPADNSSAEPVPPPEPPPAVEPAASAPATPAEKTDRKLRAARASRSKRPAPAPKMAG